jgi:catechol 2,3-dioxygenase-like lactoylglutathione lyase family enzyme
MFDHLGFYTAQDLRERGAFYSAVLDSLGYRQIEEHAFPDGTGWLVFGTGLPQSAFFVIAKGRPERWSSLQQPGLSPIHIAFRAPSKAAVDEFHTIGLREGAVNNGDPGVRRVPYYCCFLLDADGNNIEAGLYLESSS